MPKLKMPFLQYSSTIKPILLPMSILLMSFLVVLSQVSVAAEGAYCEGYNENDRLTIAVPGNASCKHFVNKTMSCYSDFCIDVFDEARKRLGCELKYTYVEFFGTDDELIKKVNNKTYSAAVGDITIIADHGEDVVFTVPFTESDLMLVIPVPGPKAWIFLKPFSLETWLTIAAVLVYTMFTIWFLEHREPNNPEFNDPRRNVQFGNALWFTFTSFFLAHREKLQSNYSRIVVVAWLFLALVLTQSYTANLILMLTKSRLRPIYLQEELHYMNVSTTPEDISEYLAQLESGGITAAYLQSPYAKVFINTHCGKFIGTRMIQRIGGFGFIFGKDHSPLAANVSKAILELSEKGILTHMETYWLTPHDCSESMKDADGLSLRSLWGLFLFSVGTSSVCFLLCLGHLLRNYHLLHSDDKNKNSESGPTRNRMQVARSIARYIRDAEIKHRSPTSRNQVVPVEAELIGVEQQA